MAKRQFDRPMTADELMEKLRHDPEWVARERERERERRVAEQAFRAEETPTLQDIAHAGLRINSVWDLVNESQSYPEAIPVLMKHLPIPYHRRIREGIARALTVKEAKGVACRVLLEEFKKSDDPSPNGFKWALANALSVTADQSVLDELIELAADRSHDGARDGIVRALANFPGDERVVDVLIDVLSDETVAGHAVTALGKLKAKRAEPCLERFLTHPQAWVRKEAKKAIEAIRRTDR